MKFTYWLTRIFGSLTTFLIAIFGLAVVAGLIAGSWYLIDGKLVTDLTTSIQKIINEFSIDIDGTPVPIPQQVQDIVKTLTTVKDFLTNNATLIKGVANGVFIGSIVFASVFVLAIIGWGITRGSYKRQKIAAIQKNAIQQHNAQQYGNQQIGY